MYAIYKRKGGVHYVVEEFCIDEKLNFRQFTQIQPARELPIWSSCALSHKLNLIGCVRDPVKASKKSL